MSEAENIEVLAIGLFGFDNHKEYFGEDEHVLNAADYQPWTSGNPNGWPEVFVESRPVKLPYFQLEITEIRIKG